MRPQALYGRGARRLTATKFTLTIRSNRPTKWSEDRAAFTKYRGNECPVLCLVKGLGRLVWGGNRTVAPETERPRGAAASDLREKAGVQKKPNQAAGWEGEKDLRWPCRVMDRQQTPGFARRVERPQSRRPGRTMGEMQPSSPNRRHPLGETRR